jgi:AcrR family transcriptional regulator
VIDAMFSLLQDGKVPVSAELVADRAGVSVASVFRYFDGLDDLQYQTFERFRERFEPLLVVTSDVATRDERIAAFVDSRIDLYEQAGTIMAVGRLRALEYEPLVAASAEMRGLLADQVRSVFAIDVADVGAPRRRDRRAHVTRIVGRDAQDPRPLTTRDRTRLASGDRCGDRRVVVLRPERRQQLERAGQWRTTMRPSRFEGTIGRTVADSTPFFDEPPHPGDDAPNVVVVLLDDTGYRPVRVLRLRHRHTERRRPRRSRSAVHQLPRHATVLADEGLAADRSSAARGGDARRVELPHRLPEHARSHLQPRGHDGGGPARRRVRHLCRGQVASRPDGAVLGCGTVRPVAARPWLRPVLRIPGGRDRSVPSGAGGRQPSDHATRRSRRRLPPVGGSRRSGAADDLRQRRRPARPAVLHLSRLRRDPRSPSGAAGVPGEVPREPSTRGGTSCVDAGSSVSSNSA